MNRLCFYRFFSLLFFGTVMAQSVAGQPVLENTNLKVTFDETGIASISDKQLGFTFRMKEQPSSITLSGESFNASSVDPVSVSRNKIIFTTRHGAFSVDIVYELQEDWRFVSKQLILSTDKDTIHIDELQPFAGEWVTDVVEEYLHKEGRYGAFLRFSQGDDATASHGVFVALQNPFMEWVKDEEDIVIKYSPDMEWQKEYGHFASDRLLIGTYKLSGEEYPSEFIPEWDFVDEAVGSLSVEPMIDYAEIEALTKCVETFSVYKPTQSLRVHVGWTENDFQIDVATEVGRHEYKRIIDRASEVGSQHVLYTPHHSGLASVEDNTDEWGFENLLWLNLGQKIRRGDWHPGKDSIPEDVREMVEYAASKNLGLLAYVYPTLPFGQDPEWLKWTEGTGEEFVGADTGVRSFQDWFIDLLIEFYYASGISGYSFDYWWIKYEYPGSTSLYAQWYGNRRILEHLRARIPEIVIDGRQSYFHTGPWILLSGSYPHPMASDEQPFSIDAFPDLSWSRVSANRTRYANWWYRMSECVPVELVPGYMTHQTQRFDGNNKLHRSRFRPRDWDYSGWKYSVLSSIGTAPFNHVINYLPARDSAEFKSFSTEDKKWIKWWFDWTDRYIDYMRALRPIIGQPMLGRIDGSAAIVNDRGFVFLFNPNYRSMVGRFALNATIGLDSGEDFLLKRTGPDEALFIGHPEARLWKYGEEVSIPLEGTHAVVFEIIPVGKITEPVLLNIEGDVTLSGRKLAVENARGPIGHTRDVVLLIPEKRKISELLVNGKPVPFDRMKNGVKATLQFAGTRFDQAQQIGEYSPRFEGGKFQTSFTVPERIFRQLDKKLELWPIPYTEDDLKATWLGPHRLLLFIQIAEVDDKMDVHLWLDGEEMEVKKAYSSVYPPHQTRKNQFLGFYVELSSKIRPDVQHEITVRLPSLKAGQFQGLYLHNITTENTREFSIAKPD